MNRTFAWGTAAAAVALIAAHGHVSASQARDYAVRSSLVWFDRSGKRLGSVGDPADYGTLELSPDGKQVAVAVLDRNLGTNDIWLLDVAGGKRTQFTSNAADENWAIWSPDSTRLVFNSTRSNSQLDLYQAPAAGGAEESLLKDGVAKWPVSWSSDGRNILYVTSTGPGSTNSIWVLPLFGDRKPYAYLDSPTVAQNWASFSPDGKWIAYTSDESQLQEVYVSPFPATGGRKVQVSRGGGFQARWRRDGKELFFLGLDRTLMSAAVTSNGSIFTAQPAEPLFDMKFAYAQYRAYDVSADGQRFLVNTLVAAPSSGNSLADNANGGFSIRTIAQTKPVEPPAATARTEVEAAFKRGTDAFAKQQMDTAITEFTQAIRLDPTLPAPRYWLGQAYLRTREYEPALLALAGSRDAYRKAFVKEPAALPLAIGSAYMHLGKLADAEREYREALAIDEHFGEAHNNLAVLYLMSGLFDHAQEEVTAAEQAGFIVDPNFKRELKEKSGQ